MYEVECVVVGAGVVGLAIARELAIAGREVIVLEAEGQKGLHASSRNTSVIHAGINYAMSGYKGRLCRDGKQQLYRYCNERNIPHKRIGKLVTADKGSGEGGLHYLRKLQAKAKEQLETLDHVQRTLDARARESPADGRRDKRNCASGAWLSIV